MKKTIKAKTDEECEYYLYKNKQYCKNRCAWVRSNKGRQDDFLLKVKTKKKVIQYIYQ
jgi:hypothetical protein